MIWGIVGLTFALAALQRWASIGAGTTILIGFLAPARYTLNTPLSKVAGKVRSGFAQILKRRTLGSAFLLGLLNGFLPCGLVYVACAVAITLESIFSGVGYMLAFGLGTVPIMLSIGLLGTMLQFGLRLRFQRLIPFSVVALGVLLILRGMALGIPYVSPVLTSQQSHCAACLNVPAKPSEPSDTLDP